eukprot:TRINITY_DN75391_c0_g1_i1.p1 TRINITY_DN75391_c0_g1~~TRINITY_DN75391_c0_g1_i1.p1  ORF type:complete len:261 (+),score=47.65 TRINITY_DN75391_c0_g1_i1:70-852(+)
MAATRTFSAGAAASAGSMLRAWTLQPGRLRLELHLTPDIVTAPPRVSSQRGIVLVNPANEALVGTKLPYFPMPSDPPPGLQHSGWCGMEAGGRMFYPMQVIDGQVHLQGGPEMQRACLALPEVAPGVRCPTGSAVATAATGALAARFVGIVHTAPPMYGDAGWAASLASCYRSACKVAWAFARDVDTIAFPLLGSGARGAPVGEAAIVAAEALAQEAATADLDAAVAGCRNICVALQEATIGAEVAAAFVEVLGTAENGS